MSKEFKKFLLFLFLLLPLPFYSIAQIITTFAGGGSGGDGSIATAASINNPNGVAFDKQGNFYFTELLGYKIRKVNTSGIITTFAGTGTAGFSGDGGPATAAQFNQPGGLAIDSSGDLYIADNVNNRIRKIDLRTGIITTVAGNASVIGAAGLGVCEGDGGPATASTLSFPQAIAFDSEGNMYISDFGNSRVRKLDHLGIITTYAGTGRYGSTGDGAQATLAPLLACTVCVDADDNVYVAGYGDSLSLIRKIDKWGIISRYAGIAGSYRYNGDDRPATATSFNPAGMVFGPDGCMYFADIYNDRIRKIDKDGIIHTIAGTGTGGYTGNGGPATAAQIARPGYLVFDTCGNLYFSQTPGGFYIRKITYPYCNYLSVPETIANETGLSIYPNPATEELHLNDVRSSCSYMLYNTLGQAVAGGALKQGNNTVVMQYLSPGIYVLYITDEAGKKHVHRVVKGN